ncbi:MAG: hypothetical protein Ta2D_03300 [Rickettsiales bacterium]|nr:MAG: hypothetical protein Ta2D_03300 [Rickettsiales bacterium]
MTYTKEQYYANYPTPEELDRLLKKYDPNSTEQGKQILLLVMVTRDLIKNNKAFSFLKNTELAKFEQLVGENGKYRDAYKKVYMEKQMQGSTEDVRLRDGFFQYMSDLAKRLERPSSTQEKKDNDNYVAYFSHKGKYPNRNPNGFTPNSLVAIRSQFTVDSKEWIACDSIAADEYQRNLAFGFAISHKYSARDSVDQEAVNKVKRYMAFYAAHDNKLPEELPNKYETAFKQQAQAVSGFPVLPSLNVRQYQAPQQQPAQRPAPQPETRQSNLPALNPSRQQPAQSQKEQELQINKVIKLLDKCCDETKQKYIERILLNQGKVTLVAETPSLESQYVTRNARVNLSSLFAARYNKDGFYPQDSIRFHYDKNFLDGSGRKVQFGGESSNILSTRDLFSAIKVSNIKIESMSLPDINNLPSLEEIQKTEVELQVQKRKEQDMKYMIGIVNGQSDQTKENYIADILRKHKRVDFLAKIPNLETGKLENVKIIAEPSIDRANELQYTVYDEKGGIPRTNRHLHNPEDLLKSIGNLSKIEIKSTSIQDMNDLPNLRRGRQEGHQALPLVPRRLGH